MMVVEYEHWFVALFAFASYLHLIDTTKVCPFEDKLNPKYMNFMAIQRLSTLKYIVDVTMIAKKD